MIDKWNGYVAHVVEKIFLPYVELNQSELKVVSGMRQLSPC
jgi:hypothetical protein